MALNTTMVTDDVLNTTLDTWVKTKVNEINAYKNDKSNTTITVSQSNILNLKQKGIENIGATCFLNATLQLLYDITPFQDAISSSPDLDPVITNLKNFYKLYNTSTTNIITNADVNKLFNALIPDVLYSLYITDTNNNAITTINKSQYKHKINSFITNHSGMVENDSSEVITLLFGYLNAKIDIANIYFSEKEEIDCVNLSRSIKIPKPETKIPLLQLIPKESATILTLITEYQIPADIDSGDTCFAELKNQNTAYVSLGNEISKLPIDTINLDDIKQKTKYKISLIIDITKSKYLIIHLKRFIYHTAPKNQYSIKIESKFMFNFKPLKLIGAIIHLGPAINSGHYHYWHINNNNNIIICNDSSITEVNLNDTYTTGTYYEYLCKNSYILLYEIILQAEYDSISEFNSTITHSRNNNNNNNNSNNNNNNNNNNNKLQ